MTHTPNNLNFRDLGRIGYADAYALQNEIHAQVFAGHAPPTVLLLEHDPVITMTRRDGVADHLLASRPWLAGRGIEVVETDRGGDITYHGPGQLVAYPIVPLQRLGMNVRQYVCALESAVMDTLAAFAVAGRRDPAGIGVWVGPLRNNIYCGLRISDCGFQASPESQLARRGGKGRIPDNPQSAIPNPQSSKIASIGVRVRRWVTLHGLALNVTTNLSHFQHIVPCGLSKPMTSLEQLLGGGCPGLSRVKDALCTALENRLCSGAKSRSCV